MAGHSKWANIQHRKIAPDTTIERAIRRGSGVGVVDAAYQAVRYEGYGPGGAAVLVECITDNRDRTVAEVRHAFAEHGGDLGAEDSVAYLFSPTGILLFPPGTAELALTEAAFAVDAEDVIPHRDGSLEVLTDPAQFERVREGLAGAGFDTGEAAVTLRAATTVELAGDAAEAMAALVAALEDLHDVATVHTNAAWAEAGLAPA